MVLRKITIENFLTQEVIFTKTIRGEFDCIVEPHQLEGGITLQINLFRNHPQIHEFIEKALEKKVLNKQHTKVRTGSGVLRLTFNDDKKMMINSANMTTIDITEYNFNPKDFAIKDFEKGKVAIFIDFTFDKEVDNLKAKQDVKELFMEVKEC